MVYTVSEEKVFNRANKILGDLQTGSVGNSYTLLQQKLGESLPNDKYSIVSQVYGKGGLALDKKVKSLFPVTLLIAKRLEHMMPGSYFRLLAFLSSFGYLFLDSKETPVFHSDVDFTKILTGSMGYPNISLETAVNEFTQYVQFLTELREIISLFTNSEVNPDLSPAYLLNVRFNTNEQNEPIMAVGFVVNTDKILPKN